MRTLTLCLVVVVTLFGVLPPALAQDAPAGPLAGRVIVISPGHGWTYLEDCRCYSMQRAHVGDLVEDVLNSEFAMPLYAMLTSAGATVYPARNLDPGAGNGNSGHPRWQENARQHLMSLGLPEDIWDYGGYALFSDIISRPRYANYVNADIFISIHNNAGGGSGTNVYYSTSNNQAAGSAALGHSVYSAVMNRIHTDYSPDWIGRGITGTDIYAEINRAEMPAMLIEVAFFDRPAPDAVALHDPHFKNLVALGIYEGIVEYFTGVPAPGGTAGTDAAAAPTATGLPSLQPGTLRAPVAVVVRSGPGMSYPQVDVLPAGQIAWIQDNVYDRASDGDWLMIGENEWVAAWIVETAEGGGNGGVVEVDVTSTETEEVPSGAAPTSTDLPPLQPGTLRARQATIVRSGPGMSYPQVDVLLAGQIAWIQDSAYDIEIDGNWLMIGENEWVAEWIVETAEEASVPTEATLPSVPTEPDNTPAPTVTEAPLEPGTLRAPVAVMVRGGPGTAYPTVDVLPAGARAVIEGRSANGFWLVIGEGRWVGTNVVEVGGDIESLPVVDAPPLP